MALGAGPHSRRAQNQELHSEGTAPLSSALCNRGVVRVLSNLASSSAKGAVPSCPAEAVVEQRQMLGVPKRIGGAEVCVREVRLENQERSQRGRRFRYPRGMPKRGNEPVVGTDILRLSVNRVCRSINSTVDVAKQKARERQVG